MARTRNLKPGFFLNERLAELHPLTRILFEGLWCHADREGRLEDRPKKIKAQVLPYDDHDIDKALNVLQAAGFILRYLNCEASYIQVLAFLKHQNPHVKEPACTIPAPGKNSSSTGQAPGKNSSGPASNGILDLGSGIPSPNHLPDAEFIKQNSLSCAELCSESEQTPAPKSGIFLQTCKKGEEWEVPAVKLIEWKESYSDVNVRQTLLEIKQWLRDNPTKRKTARGMVRFIGAWMLREQNKPGGG